MFLKVITVKNANTYIYVKNHVVFVKPFWYYRKVMSESADHNIIVFVWRIDSIAMCIVAKYSTFNKKKDIVNKNVEM